MDTRAKLSKDQYAFNKNSETHLLVELSAPRVEIDENRAPLCLVPILDVSGSMAGSKIEYVRKACRKLMDHLAPGDYAGVVAFDSNVYEIASIMEVTQEQKERLKAEIAKLNVGSCTNISGGLAKALEMVNAMDLPSNTIMRVILFTDGHANVGVTGRQLLEFSNKMKERATISSFGFGTDCDQELLADISSRSDGNYAFIDSADAAMGAFGKELGGLMTTYGQDIKVAISPDKNNQILEILNDEDVTDDSGKVTIGLRDILGEEKKWIVAKIKLNEVSKALPREVTAVRIAVEFTDRDGKKQLVNEFPVKVKFCRPCDEPTQEDPEVVKHRDRLLASKAQEEAERHARSGNYKMAQQAITLCCDSLCDENTRGTLESLNASYASASSYTANKGVTNSVRHLFKQKRLSSTGKKHKKYAQSAGEQESAVVSNFVSNFTGNGTGDGKVDDWDSDADLTVNVTPDPNTTTTGTTKVSTTTDAAEDKKEDTKSKKRSNYDW